MSQPAPAPYQSYAAPPAFVPPPPKKGAGLAIASMVLGIVALLLGWLPIINTVAAVIAVVGIGLGIPALLRARRGTSGGKGLAITGLVTSVVAIVVVIATQAFYAQVIDDVEKSISDAAATGQSSPSEEAPIEDGAAADVVPLGTPAQVGDYQVTVDALELNADAIIAGANEFNEPPAGQYVMAQLSVTYTGTEEGFPGMDLTAVFHGADNRQYSDADCMAVLPDDALDAPTLNPGGSDTFQFCMDVPPAAIDGGHFSIEPTMSLSSDERVFYAIG